MLLGFSSPGAPVTSAPSLRPYQEEAIAGIRAAYGNGRKRVLLVAPTGSGKTTTFAYVIAHAAKRGRRILILAHRVEIVDQIQGALKLAGVAYGVIAPGYPESDVPVQIASVATMARRLDRWRDRFDFVVVDEAHHSVSPTWANVLASQPNASVLGVSATPERLDGRGLREVGFEELVEGPSTAELIEAGWLSRFAAYEPAGRPDLSQARIRAGDFALEDIRDAMSGVVIQSAVDEYLARLKGKPTVVFCLDVAHSETIADRFCSAGVRAAHVDGDTRQAERRAFIAALGDGSLDVLTNCGLIAEGVDVPSIVGAILLRPTASLAVFLQQVGRALRPAPRKDRAVILDFAGNIARHGLPDAPRAWSLDSRRRNSRVVGERQTRTCTGCGAINAPAAILCAGCGADLSTPEERAEIALALREAKRVVEEEALRLMKPMDRWRWAGANEQRLRLVARVSGYKPGWVFRRLQELAAPRPERAGA
jgi:DNA repair protein RadD